MDFMRHNGAGALESEGLMDCVGASAVRMTSLNLLQLQLRIGSTEEVQGQRETTGVSQYQPCKLSRTLDSKRNLSNNKGVGGQRL